ncbi:DNA/RNA helicase domain-containing protein, partial [Chloroflexota bacterium]
GEAGLPEWFRALGEKFNHWDVFVSDRLTEYEYDRGQDIYQSIEPDKLNVVRSLHLATSIRSFRSDKLASFVKSLLDMDVNNARQYFVELEKKYPILITRDFEKAKTWIRCNARGTERYGLVSSSGAKRLRPFGISVKVKIDPIHWFLNNRSDIRSSYFLEDVATEFDIQGLELDWTIVGWDGDLRFIQNRWEYHAFRGTNWEDVHSEDKKIYLKNAYRVLLTRARQGMIIFVPEGDNNDQTRTPEFYNGTYLYLRSLGIQDIT